MAPGYEAPRSPLATGAHLLAQVIDEGDDHITAICGPLVIARYKVTPDAARLEKFAQDVERLVEAKGVVSLLLVVTVDQAPEVDEALLEVTRGFASRFEGKVLAQGVVLTGAGFSSAVLRSWTEAFAAGGGWPVRSFASLEGACGWLARRPEQAVEINRPRKLFEAVSPSLGLGLPGA